MTSVPNMPGTFSVFEWRISPVEGGMERTHSLWGLNMAPSSYSSIL